MNVRIVAVLLIWILACGARHIPQEKEQHNLDYENDYEEVTGYNHPRLLNHPGNRGEKRVPSPLMQEDVEEDSVRSNELNDGFDEYPIVTPKRAAMLLDRIMVALHHALEDSEDGKVRKINDVFRDGHYYGNGQAKPKSASSADTPSYAKSFKYGAKGRVVNLSKGNKIPYSSPKLSPSFDEDSQEEFEERRSLSDVTGDEDKLAARDNTMDLQRRGHDLSAGSAVTGKGRVYWRCYFNAVTCF